MDEAEGLEKVYLPRSGPYSKPVSWCTKKVNVKEYFAKYYKKLKATEPEQPPGNEAGNSRPRRSKLRCQLSGFEDISFNKYESFYGPKQMQSDSFDFKMYEGFKNFSSDASENADGLISAESSNSKSIEDPTTSQSQKNVNDSEQTKKKTKPMSKKSKKAGVKTNSRPINKTNNDDVTIENAQLASNMFDSICSDLNNCSINSGSESTVQDLSLSMASVEVSSLSNTNTDIDFSISSSAASTSDVQCSGRKRKTTVEPEPCEVKRGKETDQIHCIYEPDNDSQSNFDETYNQDSVTGVIRGIAQIPCRSKRTFTTVRGSIIIDSTLRSGKKDLTPGDHFFVSFRIHKPYKQAIGMKGYRTGKCLQEINVLNFQTLDDLRQKIICEADYQDTAGNVSNWPYAPITTLAKDKYTSSMFYFDNTFYIDTKNGDKDYSAVIKKWAKEHNIEVGETLPMHEMRVENLIVRLGYPYVFMHQGCCEHIIIVSQMRFLRIHDSLHSSDYPNICKVSRSTMTYCGVCLKRAAKWIVTCSDRMPYDVNYLCQGCFQSYHYRNTEKIGNFKAYRWKQRALILY